MGSSRCVCGAAELSRETLYHYDPAAKRHRQPAHGSCTHLYFAGCADPLATHAGLRRALATRNGSCRHCHANGGRTPVGGGRTKPANPRARSVSCACVALERGIGRLDYAPVATARCLIGLGARTLYYGSWAFARCSRGLCPALPRRFDLSRPALGELGPRTSIGDLRS